MIKKSKDRKKILSNIHATTPFGVINLRQKNINFSF